MAREALPEILSCYLSRATNFLLLLPAIVFLCSQAYASNTEKQSINIEVTTHLGDKQKFKAGDKIAFLVSLDNDAHLLMIYEDAEHNLIQVIPNAYRKNSLYKKGLFIAVPDREEPFEFLVNSPFGSEKLWVFASSKQFPVLDGIPLKNGLKKLEKKLPEVLSAIRPAKPDILFGQSSTVITTETR